MNSLIGKLQTIWSGLQSSVWWRVIGIVFILSSLGLMGRSLVLNISQFKALYVHFDWLSLIIGLLLAWVAMWMGTFAWGEILRSLHPDIPYRDAINYHLFSLAAKYLPGFGWQQVSKVFQLHRGGISARLTWQPVALEFVLVILVGLAIAVQYLSAIQKVIIGMALAPGLEQGIAVILWICCGILPILMLRFANARESKRANPREFLLHLYFAELLDIIGWLALGLSLWFTVRGFAPLRTETLNYYIITLIFSFLAGLVVVFAPNGFGVREVVMSTMLQTVLSVPTSIIVAFMFRIISILAEFLGVLPVLLQKIWRRQK